MARVAAWLFNEGSGTTAAEYGGNAALQFLLNGCTLGPNGIDFSGGSTDYAEIGSANNSALRLSPPFTIATRITTPATIPYLQFYHATDTNLNGNFSGSHLITNASGNLEFMYGNNTGSSSTGRRSWVAGVLAANTTYDIVAVCTNASGGTTGVTLYVNGVAVSTTQSGTGGAMVYTNNPTTVGRWIRGGRDSAHTTRYLAVYDHAFTAEEAAAISEDYMGFIVGDVPTTVTASSEVSLFSSATLVPWQTVTVAEPIDFSIGSIFHEDNWAFGTPTPGQKIHFDPRDGFSVDSSGQMSADVNSGVWVCRYDDGTNVTQFEVAFYAWATRNQSGVFGSASVAAHPRVFASSQAHVTGSAELDTLGAIAVAISSSSQSDVQGYVTVRARALFAAASQAGVYATASIAIDGIQATGYSAVQGSAQITVSARFAASSYNTLQGSARLKSQGGTTPIGSRYTIGIGLGLDIGPSFSEAA